MANVLSFTFGTFTGLGSPRLAATGPTSGAQSYEPRGNLNEIEVLEEPGAGGGVTRPDFGQMWPRGTVRGNA